MDFSNLFGQKEQPKNFDEKYLVSVGDTKTGEVFYVLAPSRKDMGEMMTLMGKERYMIASMALMPNYKEFQEFIKELKKGDNNKPDGLNFGKDN